MILTSGDKDDCARSARSRFQSRAKLVARLTFSHNADERGCLVQMVRQIQVLCERRMRDGDETEQAASL